jgi:hypothetical protein
MRATPGRSNCSNPDDKLRVYPWIRSYFVSPCHIVPYVAGRVRRASSSARPRHLQSLLQSTTRYSMGKPAVWDPAMLENQAAAAGAPILIGRDCNVPHERMSPYFRYEGSLR